MAPKRRRFAGPDRNAIDGATPRYLTKAKAAELWEAASALMQLHGLMFNLRILIRHDDLGLDQEAGTDLAAAVIHELGQGIKRWTSGRGELHYAYLHQLSPRLGFTTTVIGHVPVRFADDVDEWLFDRFLPRRFGSAFPKAGVQLRVTYEAMPERRVRRHWRLVRLLCRNLDPSLQVRVGGELKPLIDLLGVSPRLREPLGALTPPHPCRTSRAINRSAREQAGQSLPLLSAWRDGAWSHVAGGWELKEHADREREAAEWARQREVVVLASPDGGSEREHQIQEARLAELEASWPPDPRRRERSWIGWWAEGLRFRG